MHYIQFKDGVPLEVHMFQNLSDYQCNFYIWTPPNKEYCYEYQNGKRKEKIYAFLFQLTTQEKNDKIIRNSGYPDRLETTLITLDLIFEKERHEYGELIRRAIKTRVPFFMVTDHGVFNERAVNGNYTSDCNITLGDHDSVIASTFVNNIIDTLAKEKPETHLDLCKRALATGILGEYFVAKTPPWYIKAIAQYGAKEE